MRKYKAYKNDICGIYKIIHVPTGKFYVGSSNEIYRRWATHKLDLNKNKHVNQYLQNAWNKYGEDQFKFVIVELMDSYNKSNLLQLEQQYLDIHFNSELCYNLSDIAAGGRTSTKTDRDLEIDRRKNIFRALKSSDGLKLLQKHNITKDCVYDDILWNKRTKLLEELRRKKISEFSKNNVKKYTNSEYRKNISRGKLGSIMSDTTKRKISEINKMTDCRPKLTVDQRKQLCQEYKTGKYTQKQLADIFGICPGTVNRHVKNPIYNG